MAQIVPVQPVPSQTLAAVLGGQSCQLAVYQKRTGLYMDLMVGGVVLFTCVACLNEVLIVRGPALGFVGNLVFMDTQGSDDPSYEGLGSRWVLFYLAPGDLPAGAPGAAS